MRLENLLALIDGSLQNVPSISGYNEVVFSLSRLKRGDLFFLFNTKDIEQAIQKGAYVLIYDDLSIKATDNEIAWIYVESLNKAIHKFFRFYFLTHNIHPFLASDIELQIMEQLHLPSHITLIAHRSQESYEKLWNIHSDSFIFSDDKEMLLDIFADFTPLVDPTAHLENITLTNHTLFQISFFWQGQFYTNLSLPRLYLPQFQNVLNFLLNHNIEFSLHHFNFIHAFYPLFISKSFKSVEFGRSNRVIILTNQKNDFKEIYNYLGQYAKWASLLCIKPASWKSHTLQKCLTCNNYYDIVRDLKNNHFNFALLGGLTPKEFENLDFDLKTIHQKELF